MHVYADVADASFFGLYLYYFMHMWCPTPFYRWTERLHLFGSSIVVTVVIVTTLEMVVFNCSPFSLSHSPSLSLFLRGTRTY